MRTFYRIVLSNPPTEVDFTTQQALGRRSTTHDPELLRLADGLSVFSTERQARQKAWQYPWLGSFISRLNVPDDSPIRIEKTLGRGHHTLWGTPEQLAACVVATLSLES